MTKNSIESRVRRVMAATLGCAEADLREGAKINKTKGWDSLAHVQLILALEEEFGGLLPAEAALRLTSLDRIVRYFEKAPKPAPGGARIQDEGAPGASAEKMDLERFAEAFEKALRDLGVEAGDLLLVHSFLGPLRTVSRDWPVLCKRIIDLLREVLGAEGTLVMPTFTSAFTRTGMMDPERTPSETGVLTEHFRRLPGARYTMHPVHRFAAMGPVADALAGSECRSAFGPGSPLNVMHRLGGKILFLSADWESCTFFHYVEEQFEVSYRYYKDMTGTIVRPDGAKQETWQEFAGDWGYGVEDSFNAFGRRVDAGGLSGTAWAGPARLKCCRMDRLFEFTYAALEENLKCLIEI